MFWGHRTYIDILTQAPQSALCDRILPDLLAGQLAGATGLSNVMKFLSGLEELQIGGVADGKGAGGSPGSFTGLPIYKPAVSRR